MSKQYHKTILIVCEGEGTEPEYFKEIRDILLLNEVDVAIEIKPRPKDKFKKDKFKLRKGAIKREIRKPEIVLPISEIEDKYTAQPTRYVREAQIGLKDNTYDEVWAIFDKDGHPKHKEAFELAEENVGGKKVNIAFNSIAFEYWILLHFESNQTAFVKSMCREAKDPLNCGSNKHHNDCKGVNCVCGRIVTQNFLDYEAGKKSFNFKKFHPNVNSAIERAILLRKSYIGNTNPIYKLNPYTNTDRLVYKLLHLDKFDLFWFQFHETQFHDSLHINFNYQNQIVEITIDKVDPATIIITPDLFCLFDIDGNKLDSGQREVMTGDVFIFSIDLSIIQNFNPLYIGIRKSENEYLITELPI
jgi:hypothetical protein